MGKLIPLRRVLGAASCAFALFAVTGLSGASAAPAGGGNACLKDAFEYCGYEYDSNTPEFAACVAHYKAVYCP